MPRLTVANVLTVMVLMNLLKLTGSITGVGLIAFVGCIPSDSKITVQKQVAFTVTREIEYLGEDIYEITLNVDINENIGLYNFRVNEYVPYGLKIIEVSEGGLYKDKFRSRANMINWIGSSFRSNMTPTPEREIKDQVLTYKVKASEEYSPNVPFNGEIYSILKDEQIIKEKIK